MQTGDFVQRKGVYMEDRVELSAGKKLIFSVIVISVLTLLGLGVLELGLRVWTPVALEMRMRRLEVDELQATGEEPVPQERRKARKRKFNTMYADDERLGYRLAKNFEYDWEHPEFRMLVKTNSLGLREDREFADKQALRILVLGDSFVFGLGVQRSETFQAVLERRLSKRLGQAVEVINAGVPGYGTCHERLVLEDLLPKLQPDLVLLCFYAGNDLVDNLHCMEMGVASERIVDGVFMSAKRYHVKTDELERQRRQGWKRLLLWSYAYNLLEMKLEGLMVQTGARPQPQTLYKSVYKFHRRDGSDEEQRVIAHTREQLEQMKRLCDEKSVKFAVAILPAQLQVYDELFAQQLAGFKVKAEEYVIDRPNQLIAATAADLGLPVTDLYRPFHDRRETGLYYQTDGHWTNRGHIVAGQALEQFLLPILDARH